MQGSELAVAGRRGENTPKIHQKRGENLPLMSQIAMMAQIFSSRGLIFRRDHGGALREVALESAAVYRVCRVRRS